MEEKLLSSLFRRAYPKMRAFFHKRLKGRILKKKMSETKSELVSQASLKVMEAIHKDRLEKGYSFDKLVIMCCKDIWSDYVRKMTRDKTQPQIILTDMTIEEPISLGFLKQYEYNDTMQLLLQMMKPQDRKMMQKNLDGHKLKEIAAAEHASYESMKVRMSRLKNWMKDRLS